MIKTRTDNEYLQSITKINRLIHEPSRLLILAYLYIVEKADFLFLLQQTGLTHGNLSAHLRKLESEGYVNIDKKFEGKIPRTILNITNKGRKALLIYRKNMKKVFEALPE